MNITGYILPFALAFVAFVTVFLAIDFTIMNLQGLSLIFQP